MKIYQVVELGGEYEDKYEVTIGTFLNKDKAEALIDKLNKKLENVNNKHCYYCKANDYTSTNRSETERILNEIKSFCNIGVLSIDTETYEDDTIEYWIDCEMNNYFTSDVRGYIIVENEIDDCDDYIIVRKG